MIIHRLTVRHFRSILDASIDCKSLTALVGRNGAGKSSFLQAMEFFYSNSPRLARDDFFDRQTDKDIEIQIVFGDLTNAELERWKDYVIAGLLSVVRVFTVKEGSPSGLYHGERLQNAEFAAVRQAGGKRDMTTAYNKLRDTGKYPSLESARSADAAEEQLGRWETAHPEECARGRDVGAFFNYGESGVGDLRTSTRFLRIPAVRDASEYAVERRGSGVSELMDLVVHKALAARKDLIDFQERIQDEYRALMDPSKLGELDGLEQQLSRTLRQFAPDSGVNLEWGETAPLDFPTPPAMVHLTEDGYVSTVERTGHGLQRAFVLTMLQHLAAERARGESEEGSGETGTSLPNLVLAIEEPELYQHPTRQRHIASILMRLASGSIAGVAKQTQVIYTTHSPQFVGLDRFDRIRLLRKTAQTGGQPKATGVSAIDLSDVAQRLWECHGSQGDKFTDVTLRPRMQAVMTTSVNEGFFADVVALVEGEGDRAAVLAVAETMRVDLDALGVAVVPCSGKPSMDRPALVFRMLGIHTYLVWDNDQNADEPAPERNRVLLRIVGAPEEDWPVGVADWHACFGGDLQTVLRNDLTPQVFDECIKEVRDALHLGKKEALKNPYALGQVVEKAAERGFWSSTLQNVVSRLATIRQLQEQAAN